jgi:hypothetical protein
MTTLKQTIDAMAGLLERQAEVQLEIIDRLGAVEGKPTSAPAQVAASPKRTRIVSASPELQALRGQIKRQAKANLIDKCAGHSPAAINTFVLAGSKAAREFMRGERTEAKSLEEFALVPGSAAHSYASAVAGGASPQVTATPKAKARAKGVKATAVQAKPSTKTDKALDAAMTDAQLLKSRPASASQAPAAIRTWLWRTRERIAGRDPMRAKA